jgi:hypothetical protein
LGTSINDSYVFVKYFNKYGLNETAQATDPEQLVLQ